MDSAQAKLNQMLGLKPAARPAVSLFKLNTQQVIHFVELAVFYASLAAITFELKRHDCFGWYRFFDFETCAGWRNILQDRPFAVKGAGLRFPLNSNKISAEFSVFSSFVCHD